MAVDTVTLIEEAIYVACRESAELQTLIPRGGGEIKLYPHPAPADVTVPFITHDIAGDERSDMPMGGGPGLYRVPWWVAAWTDGVHRQALRPVVLAFTEALTGPQMRGRQISFTSDDGTSWELTIRRDGAMAAPAGVGDEGAWHRVMVRFTCELLNAA